MEEEEFKSVYIVKLPNNFCGIGACVIDHPDQVSSGNQQKKFWYGVFKLLRSPGIDSKESIPPAYSM